MKIIIVSNFFYPENTPRAFRTTEIAKELSRRGHKVELYIPCKNEETYKLCNEYDIKYHNIHIPDWTGFNLSGNKITILLKRIVNRILNTYIIYPSIMYLKSIPEALSSQNDADMLISIAAPHTVHWGVDRVVRHNKSLTKCWIADCGDPFMLCKLDTFRKPFYFKYLEKSFCRHADFITVPVQSAIEGYYPEFAKKIRVIPQGFDFSQVRLKKYIENPAVTFAYAGSFIPNKRDPRPILDFLVKWGRDFKFIIYTNQPDYVKYYESTLREMLEIRPFVDRLTLIEEMSGYDFLLNIENGTSIQAPSKLIDYALSKRPILSISSSNLDEDKFKSFLNRDYSGQYQVKNIQQYNIVNVVSSFLKLQNNEQFEAYIGE